MKNTLFVITALLCVLPTILKAQDYRQPVRIFKKGQTDVQLGMGILPTALLLDRASMKLLPVSIEVNHMLGNRFSLGLFHGQSIAESRPIVSVDGVQQRVTNHTSRTALKAAWHINSLPNADFYGGFMLALTDARFSVDIGDMGYLENHLGMVRRKTKLTYTGFVGGRYALTFKWNLFGEFGFGDSILTLGAGYRIAG